MLDSDRARNSRSAIAAALRRLHGLPANPGEDARVLGRGHRSGIGIFLFQQGGFVVDGGRGGERAPPLLSRLAVPDDWRILLLQDHAHEGLSGPEEIAAFAALAPLPDRLSSRICRLVLMQALPALAEDDLETFGAAVTEVQAIAGDHFAPAQGARFTSPRRRRRARSRTRGRSDRDRPKLVGTVRLRFPARRGGSRADSDLATGAVGGSGHQRLQGAESRSAP